MKTKTIIDIVLILALLYTVYYLTSPQGKELIECRTYKPTIELAKKCYGENNGTTVLYCINRQDAAMRSAIKNWSWLNTTRG